MRGSRQVGSGGETSGAGQVRASDQVRAGDGRSSTEPSAGRLLGLDAARALAVAGMIAVNVGPAPEEVGGTGLWERLYALPHGRASLLFVLLAGVGVSLLTRGVRENRGQGREAMAWMRLSWRAGLLLVAGLALQLLDHDVSVILPVYAVLFVLGGLLMKAPDGVLLGAALVSLLAAPPLWLALRHDDVVEPDLLMPIPRIVEALLISGPYPVITWTAPFVFGMWLGRRAVGERGVQVWMALGGAVVSVVASVVSTVGTRLFHDSEAPVGPSMLLTSVAHGQMPLWLVSGTATAVMLLGIALLVTARLPRLTWPLVATGQLALTVYVAHLVVLTLIRPAPHDLAQGVVITVVLVAGAVLAATLWRALFSRGPLEALLRVPETVRAARRPER